MDEVYKNLLFDKCLNGYTTDNDYELLLLNELIQSGYIVKIDDTYYWS